MYISQRAIGNFMRLFKNYGYTNPERVKLRRLENFKFVKPPPELAAEDKEKMEKNILDSIASTLEPSGLLED